jgi:4-carboxymuconolactone decarboxylase
MRPGSSDRDGAARRDDYGVNAADARSRTGERASERFPRVTKEELDAEGLALRDAILSGPRSRVAGQFPVEAADSSLEGPFGIFLFSPAVGAPLQELGARLRSRTGLTDRQRELATLAIASELACEFEIRAHLPLARNAGISADELDAVLNGETLVDPLEASLVSFCRANARDATPYAQFDDLVERLDRRRLFEVTALVAYYRGLASMLDLFGISAVGGSAESSGAPMPEVEYARPSSPTASAIGLATLLAEREISRVLVSLARCVDTFDFEGLAQLYAEDGELVTPWASHRGREGLAEHVRRDLGHYKALHHVSAGHEIYVNPGESVARARMTLLATHVLDDAGHLFTTNGGHYDISLVHEAGAWRLKRVHIVPAWTLNWDGRDEDRPTN